MGSQGDEIRDRHLQPLHGQQEENIAYTYVTFPIYNPLSYISSFFFYLKKELLQVKGLSLLTDKQKYPQEFQIYRAIGKGEVTGPRFN